MSGSIHWRSLSASIPPSAREGTLAVPPRLLAAGASILLAWQQRRAARRCCREVLRLHGLALKARPELSRRQRYQCVAAAYLACSEPDARSAVACAEANFALWPVPRDLRLRDLAHYLAASELLAGRGSPPHGVQAELRPVVDAVIPFGA